jgi:hypothetical protein
LTNKKHLHNGKKTGEIAIMTGLEALKLIKDITNDRKTLEMSRLRKTRLHETGKCRLKAP